MYYHRENYLKEARLTESTARIKWTDAEWQEIALRLLKVRPEYLNDPAPHLHPPEVREAMIGLPPERRRVITLSNGTIKSFRTGLVRAYAAIRDTLGDTLLPDLAVEPKPEPKSQTPVEKGEKGDSWRHNKRVKWNDADFLDIAKYLIRRYPGASFLHSSTGAGLGILEVREAMFGALPAARQRPLKNMSTKLRNRFVAAFKAAKMENLRQSEREERESRLAFKAAKADAIVPPPEHSERLIAATLDTALGQLLKPIIELLAQELMAQLGPRLAEAIASATQQPASSVAPLASLGKPQKERKKIIGVVGPLPIQAQDLAKAFPQYEIIGMTTDNANAAISAMRSAVRVIGMTNFLNHSTDGMLAKAFGTQYTRVTGGVSAIKRQIEIWHAAGTLTEAT